MSGEEVVAVPVDQLDRIQNFLDMVSEDTGEIQAFLSLLTRGEPVHELELVSDRTHAESEPTTPVTVFHQEERAFFRIGNYEFEVVVPPTLREHSDPRAAALTIAKLLQQQFDALKESR